jgi:hypothetical protein
MYNIELGHLIYEKYYGAAKRRGLIWTLQDWAIKNGLFTEEEIYEDDRPYCEWEDGFEHADAVKTVLAYEITFFIYRHLNGPWGEMLDFFHYGKNKFCNEYREKTGYQIIGNDEDLLY